MKYFLCTFNEIYLGIPSERTERVISVSRKQSSVCETEGEELFISLSVLFGRADQAAPHGLVLKSINENKKVTLLAPSLDIDLEIPEEDIYSVPRAFGGGAERYCRGACFITKDREERLVFIVDIEKLTDDFK